MHNKLLTCWKWLNGKKTIIASIYWEFMAAIIVVWFPNGLPGIYNKVYLSIGIILTSVGLGHKVTKNVTIHEHK